MAVHTYDNLSSEPTAIETLKAAIQVLPPAVAAAAAAPGARGSVQVHTC